ncbi:MAG: hypothetical protein M1818_003051 [Claussenomyces sp. TS43310]|nr:MAG: hypothetical protein M1818_003051 [Claussenomyces sp. TS43310]
MLFGAQCHWLDPKISDSRYSRPGSLASIDEDIYNQKGDGLMLDAPPFELEKIYDYEPGGHYPVHLGDRIGKDSRYCVVHKLGNGAFASFWMCLDLESDTYKYVGLRVLMAEASAVDCWELLENKLNEMSLDQEVGGKYICLPPDQSQIDGPSGSHLCFVFPVLGPRISCSLKESEDPDKTLRKIALQAVRVHGHPSYSRNMRRRYSFQSCIRYIPYEVISEHSLDFTLSNTLLRISGLDDLTEEQVT